MTHSTPPLGLAAVLLAVVAGWSSSASAQSPESAAAVQEPVTTAAGQDAKTLLTEIQATRDAVLAARRSAIRPIEVNGVTVTPDRFRREAIYLVGAKMVEAKIAELFTQEQVEELIEGGRDPQDFQITDEELVRDVANVVDQFRAQNPGVEFWQAIRAQVGMSREQFLAQQRQTKLFDRVFFPGPATEWPLITREAIMASAQDGGKQFWENIEKAAVDPETGKARELPPLWLQLCRGWVIKQLKNWAEIRYPSDGLEPEFCLQVNEQRWPTEEAFASIEAGLYEQDLERAVTEVVVREALQQALVEAGAYLSDEEFRAEFDEFRKPYDDTVFTVEVIATSFKGYPSLEAFRQRWRLIRSFEKMIEAEMTDEALQQHADAHAGFFADGSVNVDFIQFYARDLTTGAWRVDGMNGAKARAEAAMRAIEDGASFDTVHAEQGEFYATDKEKGRMGSKSLNQLRQTLRESEFTDVLQGFSVGNFLFFDAEPGKVYGPLRGTDAWFVVRVNSRTPPRSKVDISEERTKELVRQDYVSHRFLQWANEVLANSRVE